MAKTPSLQAGGEPPEQARLTAEIERLEVKRRQLDLALGEFLHETRRVRDALERVGGHSQALDARARALKKNVKVTRKDLEKTEQAIDRLDRRRAEIGAATDRSGGG